MPQSPIHTLTTEFNCSYGSFKQSYSAHPPDHVDPALAESGNVLRNRRKRSIKLPHISNSPEVTPRINIRVAKSCHWRDDADRNH